jgi:LacI family transcriptional regulator
MTDQIPARPIRLSTTLADVARDVGLSTSTISRALDPNKHSLVSSDTRKRVVEAAERLGYRPDLQARSLMTGRTYTVVVIAPDLGNPWVTPILHGAASRVSVEGIVPIIAETNDDSAVMADLINHMLSRRVDAIIMLAARRSDAEIIESAGRIVPTVVAARPLPDLSVPVVTHDDRAGGAMMAAHFAELGHSRVAQLRGPSDVLNFPLRFEGFTSVAKSKRLRRVYVRAEAHLPTFDEGYRLMKAMLETEAELPTAVFAHNDAMAVGAIAAAKEHNLKVPEDISIAGYNDMPMTGFLEPSLTTVRYPGWDVGHTAADVVVRLLEGEEGVSSVSLDPTFIPRSSTAEPGRPSRVSRAS